MNKIVLVIFSLFFVNTLCIGKNLRFDICTSKGESIAYCNLLINNRVCGISDSHGVCFIELEKLHEGDTIKFSSLGFHPQDVVVDQSVLTQSKLCVTLYEKMYSVDEVEVVGEFNPVKFLKKKKKRFLMPYTKPRVFSADVSVYKRVNGKDSLIQSKVNLEYRGVKSKILGSSKLDSLIQRDVIWSYGRSTQQPYNFCFAKFRKYFDVQYLGKYNKQYVFSCVLKAKYFDKKYFNYPAGSKYEIEFRVDDEGYVTHADYHSVINDESRKKSSYIAHVDYGHIDNKMVPSFIKIIFYNTFDTFVIVPKEACFD